MKLAKKTGAVLVAAIMASASIPALADTVVFEDSFERGAWSDADFLIAPPEVKVYSENLITDGDFESSDDIGRYLSAQTAWTDRGSSVNNTIYTKSTEKKHGGNKSLKIIPQSTQETAIITGHYPMLVVREGDKNGGDYDFTEGIYEFDAWLYTDAARLVIRAKPYFAYAKNYLSQNGNTLGQVALTPGKWQKIRSTFSIPADKGNIAEMGFALENMTAWTANEPLYIDDVTVRRVENATVINNAESDPPGATNQNGIAKYTMEGIIGKTVEVSVPVDNTNGEDDHEVTLISVLYDADGRFISVLGNITETVYAGTSDYSVVSTFTVPSEISNDAQLYNYLWDNMDNIRPHMRPYQYPYHPYKLTTDYYSGSVFGTSAAGKNIPGTSWMSVPLWATYISHRNYPTMFDQLSVGNGHTGMNSLYIPLPKARSADGGQGWVYRDMDLEAGHTYKATFYVMCSTDDLAFGVFPVAGSGINTSTTTPLELDVSETDSSVVLTNKTYTECRRVYSNLGAWTEITAKFTAQTTGKHSLAFTQGNNGYMDSASNGTKIGTGAFIDDVKVVDITNN